MADSRKSVLIVDDDIDVQQLLVELLGIEGFAAHSASTGEEALESLREAHFDAVILDIGLPGIDGMEVLKRIRADSTLPVIMLTARGDPIDRIVGLEVGADDYVPKPFHPRELTARLRGVLRRSGPPTPGPRISIGALRIDPGALRAEAAGRPLALTGAEFRILACLMRQAGTVVSRTTLSLAALDRELAPYDRSIDTHIANLRRKLRETLGPAQPIRTIRGSGFLLVTDDDGTGTG